MGFASPQGYGGWVIPNPVEAGERIHQRARPPKHPYRNRL